MRMWMVNPKLMCRQHLLGEHVELHMFVATINKGTSVLGYLENNCLEPRSIHRRHTEIVREMRRRGYNHKSPLRPVNLSNIPRKLRSYQVNRQQSLKDLQNRCGKCRDGQQHP